MGELKIIKIAHLIETLHEPSYLVSTEEKVKAIKLARDNGTISSDEALELVLEYLH